MPPVIPPPAQIESDQTHMSKKFRLLLGVAVVAVVIAVVYGITPHMSGNVTLIVRHDDGTRTVESYSLSSKKLTTLPHVSAATLNTGVPRLFQKPDGSVIGLTPAGVVMADLSNNTTVLIASPVAPTPQTVLAVWNGGEKIAWTNPADNSIQVFTQSTHGSYLPIALDTSIMPSTIGFTDDGLTLVAARYVKDGTEMYGMKLPGGALVKVGMISGVVKIIPKP